MLRVRRLGAALVVPLILAPSAMAQTGPVSIIQTEPRAESRLLPDFSPPRGDLREVGEPRRNGLIAAIPVGDDVQIGIGRFRVAELARSRSHMEPERSPTDMRRRERGVAAIGLSLRV